MNELIELYRQLGVKSDELRNILNEIREKQSYIIDIELRMIVQSDIDKFEKLRTTKYL